MEEERLATTLSNAQVLIHTLDDSLAEVEAATLCNTQSDAQVLVHTLADSLAEVEAATLGNTLSDAQALADTLAHTDSRGDGRDAKGHTERCASTGRHACLICSRGAA